MAGWKGSRVSPFVEDEVEDGAEVMGLGLADIGRVHGLHQVGPAEGQQPGVVGLYQAMLELVLRAHPEAGLVLKRYIRIAPATWRYFQATKDSPVKDFVAEADRHPVFELTPVGQGHQRG